MGWVAQLTSSNDGSSQCNYNRCLVLQEVVKAKASICTNGCLSVCGTFLSSRMERHWKWNFSEFIFVKFVWPVLKLGFVAIWNATTEMVCFRQSRLRLYFGHHLVENTTWRRWLVHKHWRKIKNKMPNSSVELDIDASPGSMGSPVKLGRLEGEERRRASDGWRLHAFNEWGADFTFTFLPSMSKRYLLWLSLSNWIKDFFSDFHNSQKSEIMNACLPTRFVKKSSPPGTSPARSHWLEAFQWFGFKTAPQSQPPCLLPHSLLLSTMRPGIFFTL